MELNYPTVDDIIIANKKAVELLRVTKAEKHELLAPRHDLQKIIDKAKMSGENVKTQAAILLMEINRRHIFGSANKRTSFIVAADFLLANEGKIPLKRKEDVEFLMDIRAGRKNLEDIVRWLDE